MTKDFRANVEFNNIVTILGNLTASVGTTTLGTINTGNLTSTASIVGSIVHANANNTGQNFRIGDDAWIGDINVADTISLRGLSGASANGYIRFGSDSNNFGYNSTSAALVYTGTTFFTGNFTASAASAVFGNANFQTTGNGINIFSSASTEGGQINLHGGALYSSSVMQIDNYAGDMRVLYNAGNQVALTIANATGNATFNNNLTATGGTTTLASTVVANGSNSTTFNTDGTLTGAGNSFAGAWYTTWTPTVSSSSVAPKLGTGSSTVGTYMQIGKTVIGQFTVSFGSSNSASGFGTIYVSLPVTAKTGNVPIGSGGMWDAGGVGQYTVQIFSESGKTKMIFRTQAYGNFSRWEAPFVLGSGNTADTITGTFMYEAA